MRRILYIGIALLGLSLTAEAQSSAWYRTQLLRQLGEGNQLILNQPKRDTALIVGRCKGYPVVAEWQSGIVSHLGVKLFEPELKQLAGKELCDFVERYLLEELSTESPEELERKRFDNGVSQSGSLEAVIGKKELLFSINSPQTGQYELCWDTPEGGRLFTIMLPANWELISGQNKIEQENNLRNDLAKHPIDVKLPRVPKLSRLEKTTAKGIWILKRGHYMIPAMASALYYREADSESGFELLIDREHTAESLINLLSVSALAKEYNVEITQQKYGFKKETYTINLGRLVSYCLDCGCEPYIGIEQSDEREVVATLLMVNRRWGYNHILQVFIQRNQIGKPGEVIKAKLNAFTPTHNLETLYYDEQVKKHSTAPKFTIKQTP